MTKSHFFVSRISFLLLMILAADAALARDTFILATGRRDPRIYAINLEAALDPRNNNTPNAIVSRSKVHPDRLDGTPVGDPANIVLSRNNMTAYVVNHHGPLDNAEFLQHGGRESISVMDVRRMLRRDFDNTDRALQQSFDSGRDGAPGSSQGDGDHRGRTLRGGLRRASPSARRATQRDGLDHRSSVARGGRNRHRCRQ